MRRKLLNLSRSIHYFLSSKHFFGLIIVLVVIQGMWFAMSFWPNNFDEGRHIQFIQFYSHHINPYMGDQDPSMDSLGEVSREPSYMYYYIMSLFLRVFHLFTSDSAIQAILLRLVSIATFVWGVILVRKLGVVLGISSAITHTALLMFVSIPVVGAVIGSVSYDIGVFPLIALALIYTVKILSTDKAQPGLIVRFIAVSALASVVKFTSLPITVVCSFFIFYHLMTAYWRHYHKLVGVVRNYASSLSSYSVVGVVALMGFSLFLVVERPLQNVIEYKTIAPGCLDTLPKDQAEDRCVSNYVYKRNIEFLADKPTNFTPQPARSFFFSTWVNGVISSTAQAYPNTGVLYFMGYMYYTLLVGGTVIILLGIRNVIKKNRRLVLVVAVTLVYTFGVYYTNYKGYAHLAKPVAISARYLLPIFPLFFMLLLESLKTIAGIKLRKHLPLLVVPYLLLDTQGGGIVSYLLSARAADYWQNTKVVSLNQSAQTILHKIVKE